MMTSTTTTANSSSVKRVTSKSKQELFNTHHHEKKSRIMTMADGDDQAVLQNNIIAMEDDDKDDDNDRAVPVAAILSQQQQRPNSSSYYSSSSGGFSSSSLSDENNDTNHHDAKRNDGEHSRNNCNDGEDCGEKTTTTTNANTTPINADTIGKRQVSNDDIIIIHPVPTKTADGGAGHGAAVAAASSSVRDSSFTSDRDNSLGNWGWFEDVHALADSGSAGGAFLFLPQHGESSANNNTKIKKERGGAAAGGRGGGKTNNGASGGEADGSGNNSDADSKNERKTLRGGLFHIGSEVMQSVMAMVDPHREVMNTMAVTAPTYVLEESLSSQKLWKHTAGNRPPQPVEERAFFEQMWAQNFARSQVKYEIPAEVLTASTPISISPFNDDRYADDGVPGGANLSHYNLAASFNLKSVGGEHAAGADAASVKAAQADAAEATLNQHLNVNGAVEMYFDPNRPKDYNLKTLGPHHHHHTWVNKKVKGAGDDNDLTVVVRGDNVFGTTVSKSFPRVNDKGEQLDGIDTVSISIASYRVVESKKLGKYAQFLVIFCDGNFRNTVGVWKRYSDFSELSRKITHGHSESCAAVVTGLNPLSVTDDHDVEILPNAITSWKLLKKRQRWYRCLDAGYLSLKVFLLERFLHDILFESSNPQILRDFVNVHSSEPSKLNTEG